jgi:hypothetical protein
VELLSPLPIWFLKENHEYSPYKYHNDLNIPVSDYCTDSANIISYLVQVDYGSTTTPFRCSLQSPNVSKLQGMNNISDFRVSTTVLQYWTTNTACRDVNMQLPVPPKNGLEPLKFFEPLNGVIFTTSTKKVLNTILIYTTHMAMMFLAMWSNFTMLSKTQILDASVMIITLEVGTSPILHLLILTPLSRASKFYVAIPRRIFFNDCEKCR